MIDLAHRCVERHHWAALANVLGHLRRGGRIVAGGAKWAPWWQPGSIVLNLFTCGMNRDYVTTFEGFDRPWSHLVLSVPDLHVEDVYFGGGYIAGERGPSGPRKRVRSRAAPVELVPRGSRERVLPEPGVARRFSRLHQQMR